MVVQTYNSSTQEAEAGRQQVWCQTGLHGRLCLKKKAKEKSSELDDAWTKYAQTPPQKNDAKDRSKV
jgi:hypothetical protein